MNDQLVTVAHLTKTFGVKGEMHAVSMTDFPDLRFKKGRIYIITDKDGNEVTKAKLKSFRFQNSLLLMAFEGLNSIEEAEAWRGFDVNLTKEEAPVPEGVYRFADLIGCEAFDEENNSLGTVIDFTAFAPTKNLKVKRPSGKNFYVPFIDEFIKDVNLEKKTIVIHVEEGLL
ncbi:MAG: 16S rRNA processing protein RimM [Bacilli bacterium]|nr:16S rRNA processing protein RimM [Bacilli bacterium]